MPTAELTLTLASSDPKVLDGIIADIADSPQFFGQFTQDVFGGDQRAALSATQADKREFVEQQLIVGLLQQHTGIVLDREIRAVQATRASAEPTAKAKPIAKRGGQNG